MAFYFLFICVCACMLYGVCGKWYVAYCEYDLVSQSQWFEKKRNETKRNEKRAQIIAIIHSYVSFVILCAWLRSLYHEMKKKNTNCNAGVAEIVVYLLFYKICAKTKYINARTLTHSSIHPFKCWWIVRHRFVEVRTRFWPSKHPMWTADVYRIVGSCMCSLHISLLYTACVCMCILMANCTRDECASFLHPSNEMYIDTSI